jgi:hypothetical protein
VLLGPVLLGPLAPELPAVTYEAALAFFVGLRYKRSAAFARLLRS